MEGKKKKKKIPSVKPNKHISPNELPLSWLIMKQELKEAAKQRPKWEDLGYSNFE
jgi:hypothetical protein